MSDATPAELITEQLANLPVDVSLQLNPIWVKPGMVLNLAVGDVLNLDHPQHRPLNVAVDGQTLAQAAVGASGNRLAGVIVRTEENN
nr:MULTISPECIES: FliM/FliN family flagellar motor C-terminal domain-containing protein [Arthrobacter]